MKIPTRIQKKADEIHFWKTHYEAYFKRKKIIDHYIKTHEVKKLHLGCGSNIQDSWLNSDLYGGDVVIPIDLTKKFPISTDTFDYVFSEHVIEHFTFQQGQNILREVFRILKPKGITRIATPTLEFLIKLYQRKKTPLQQRYIRYSTDEALKDIDIYRDTFVINNFFRAWGHQFIYDFPTMKWLLNKIGFVKVTQYRPGESKDINLKNLELHWKPTRKEFNDLETFVVEAIKP